MTRNNEDSTSGTFQQLHVPDLCQLVPRLVGREGEVSVTTVAHLSEHVSHIMGVSLGAFQEEIWTVLEGAVAKDANVALWSYVHPVHVWSMDHRWGFVKRCESTHLLKSKVKTVIREHFILSEHKWILSHCSYDISVFLS